MKEEESVGKDNDGLRRLKTEPGQPGDESEVGDEGEGWSDRPW